jgi:hypothetical protein
VSFVVDDAIHFVRATPKSYSLILNTVTSPLYFSSSKLYTADFFHAVKQRLRPDGIYATWVDSRIGDRGFDIIIKTLRASFKECGLFYIKNTYFLLICGETPLVYAQQHLQARAPRVWDEFTQKYNLLPNFMPYNLLTTKAFTLLEDESVPVNQLDFPALENEMASLAHDGLPRVKERVASQMNIDEVKRVVVADAAHWNPAELVVEAEQTITRKYIMHRWRELVKQIDANYEADHDSATLAYFRRVAEIGKNAEAYHNYGNELLKQQRYDEALAQFNRAIDLDDSNANTYFNMGVCYEQLGDRLKALVNYKKALNLEPDDEDILRHLNKIYQLNPEWRVIAIQ